MKIDRRLARKVYRIYYQETEEDFRVDFETWLENVGYQAEQIVLHPGGRATIPRAVQLGISVYAPAEVWWRRSGADNLPYITGIRVEAPPGHAFAPYEVPGRWDDLNVSWFWAALVLRLASSVSAPSVDAEPPAPGKKPSLDHYRKVIAEYDELVRNRHPAPISVLAERHKVRPGTVKSWLHRGHKYLKEA